MGDFDDLDPEMVGAWAEAGFPMGDAATGYPTEDFDMLRELDPRDPRWRQVTQGPAPDPHHVDQID